MLTSLLHMLLYATHCVCAAPAGEPEAELLPPAARLDGAAPLACNAGIEQAREARLWCMKLLAQLLQAFPAPSHFAPYLPLLFAAAAPCMRLYAWLGVQLKAVARDGTPYHEWCARGTSLRGLEAPAGRT